MWFITASDQAQYRITFFFGPEPLADRPMHASCTFNVKKRSWKGGVQVAVDVSDRQVGRAREILKLSDQLTQALAQAPADDRASCLARADDLLTQTVCACKLELALARGLTQENQRIPATQFDAQLEQIIADHRIPILSHILRELDLPDASRTMNASS